LLHDVRTERCRTREELADRREVVRLDRGMLRERDDEGRHDVEQRCTMALDQAEIGRELETRHDDHRCTGPEAEQRDREYGDEVLGCIGREYRASVALANTETGEAGRRSVYALRGLRVRDRAARDGADERRPLASRRGVGQHELHEGCLGNLDCGMRTRVDHDEGARPMFESMRSTQARPALGSSIRAAAGPRM
jgi:hypothetical protein